MSDILLLPHNIELNLMDQIARRGSASIQLSRIHWEILSYLSQFKNKPIKISDVIENTNPDMTLTAFRVYLHAIRKNLHPEVIQKAGFGKIKLVTISHRIIEEEIQCTVEENNKILKRIDKKIQ